HKPTRQVGAIHKYSEVVDQLPHVGAEVPCQFGKLLLISVCQPWQHVQKPSQLLESALHGATSAYSSCVAVARSRTSSTSSAGSMGTASPANDSTHRAKASRRRTRNRRRAGAPSTGSPSAAPARVAPLSPVNST